MEYKPYGEHGFVWDSKYDYERSLRRFQKKRAKEQGLSQKEAEAEFHKFYSGQAKANEHRLKARENAEAERKLLEAREKIRKAEAERAKKISDAKKFHARKQTRIRRRGAP